jgi:SAM-dependent methyltransferase
MTDNEQEQATIQTYDLNAESWANDHADVSGLKNTVAKFKKYLPNGTVVEIGSGGGRDAALLTESGYDYLGIDASKGMVAAAQRFNPGLKFKHMSVYDLPRLQRQFDGFWTAATLLHIPKKRTNEALQAISTVLKPGGVGFISMKDGDREEFEERKVSGRRERRIFAYWTKEDFEQALRRNGFLVLTYEYVPVSQRTNWHRFIVQKEA